MTLKKILQIISIALLVQLGSTPAVADSIIVQSSTSTKNSGLYDYILPIVKEETGITVNVVAVGTGQAIKNAQRCDGDVLLVHAKSSEEQFVAQGYGVKRSDLMYNDFVIVGPNNDPAGIRGSKNVSKSLSVIASKRAFFVSRGDDSGTHKAELGLWQASGVDPASASGSWYRETGSGMGATLNIAIGMDAYAMTDRATWMKFGNKGDFQIHVEGDRRLFNQYGVILVNPTKCPNVKTSAGQQVIDWLLSDRGQSTIGSYRVNGNQLFFPNAN
ncbi:MAG: substrate-binding domain-containing protein [Litoricolaceae bacterium]|nr:substrate-binding domain-containing protein [Litorivicinaceae bacterium]